MGRDGAGVEGGGEVVGVGVGGGYTGSKAKRGTESLPIHRPNCLTASPADPSIRVEQMEFRPLSPPPLKGEQSRVKLICHLL